MKLQLLKRNFKLFASVLFFALTIGIAQGQTKTWDNAGSGTNWNTPENWNPYGVPTATDDVIIPNGINTTITVNTAAVCKSFTMDNCV